METIQDKLSSLAMKGKSKIGEEEKSVMNEFIVPFLECFGYRKGRDFESAPGGTRIEIPHGVSIHKIIIEVKGCTKNLDDFIAQLRKCCAVNSPVLAILCNGEEIRFYSPFWQKPDFAERLIYKVSRKELDNPELIHRINKILSKDSLTSGILQGHVHEREHEIEEATELVKSFEEGVKSEDASIDTEIEELNGKIERIQQQTIDLYSRKAELAFKRMQAGRIICKSIFLEHSIGQKGMFEERGKLIPPAVRDRVLKGRDN